MDDGDGDPFNEELHGLRLYGWVEDYLRHRGWQRSGDSQWFGNDNFSEYGAHVSLGYAFELQLRDDGVDLNIGSGQWPRT